MNTMNISATGLTNGILAGVGAVFLVSMVEPASAQSPCGPTTTVQPGDTYFAIAQRCDVSVGFIEQANPGVDASNLQVGQTLQLSTEAQRDEPMPDDRYQVRAGDTLFNIARAMGVTLDALLEANPDINPDALQIGQIIIAPRHGAPGEPTSPAPGTQVTGILTPEGVECQAMRGHDGQLYTLTGDLDGHDDGDVVQVRGEVQEVSICQQGTTIDVADIRTAR
ncbi:lytic transglycosylase [Natronohydrobacter thiooxidans]|uniref:lytic transglycosylase n=1 Tax=Natronohydrobacter thiooxidans TaxID=87172 RepID=UPI0008FF27DD|nr:LysM domain-containing protein [Natronohydrobacter thiooxidans]